MADVEDKNETINAESQQNGKAHDSADSKEVAGDTQANQEEAANNTGKDDEQETSKDVATEDTKAGATSEQKRKEAPTDSPADDDQDRKRPRGDKPLYNSARHSRFEQPESDDADEIRRQVEFYFSDSNLPIDQYMLDLSGGSENKPVDLKVIHSFKRMRHFQPHSAVRDAIKTSSFVSINEDDGITRKVPLDEKYSKDAQENKAIVHAGNMSRSIYAKGFGEENNDTHLDIEAFFAPYGPINSIRLRRDNRGGFKGSVFVEFESDELAQQFLELETKPQWNGKDLKIQSKKEYVEEKHDGILNGVVRPTSPYRNKGRGNNRRSDDRDKRGSRDNYDKDDWKSRRDRDQEDDRRRGGRGGRGGRGQGRGGRGGRSGGQECYNCGKFGHISRECTEPDKRKRRGSNASERSDRASSPSKKRSRDDEEERGDAKKAKSDDKDEAPKASDEKSAVDA